MWIVILLLAIIILLIAEPQTTFDILEVDRWSPQKRMIGYGIYVFFAVLTDLTTSINEVHFVIILFAPFVLFSWRSMKEQREIEKGMVNFLEILNSRFLVDDDVIKALEKTAEIVPSKPIKKILHEFGWTMKVSCNPELAFQKMRSIRHPYLCYVFLNIENVLNSWGKARELVEELENEYVSVQIELNKGKAELQNDKWMTYAGLFLAAMTGYQVFLSDPQMTVYYSKHPVFAVLLAVTAIFGLIILSTTKISK